MTRASRTLALLTAAFFSTQACSKSADDQQAAPLPDDFVSQAKRRLAGMPQRQPQRELAPLTGQRR